MLALSRVHFATAMFSCPFDEAWSLMPTAAPPRLWASVDRTGIAQVDDQPRLCEVKVDDEP
jgi:hypothetical protein